MSGVTMVPGVLILALLIALVDCRIDHARFCIEPPAQHNFNQQELTGKWFYQAMLPSRSWYGSTKFTDWSEECLEEHGALLSFETWRKDADCLTTPSRMIPTGPGRYIFQDAIGGMRSGKSIVVDCDFQNYVIIWSCMKPAPDGELCDDYGLYIKTRQPDPSPGTWKAIDHMLGRLWDVTLVDLQRVLHVDPCPEGGGLRAPFGRPGRGGGAGVLGIGRGGLGGRGGRMRRGRRLGLGDPLGLGDRMSPAIGLGETAGDGLGLMDRSRRRDFGSQKRHTGRY